MYYCMFCDSRCGERHITACSVTVGAVKDTLLDFGALIKFCPYVLYLFSDLGKIPYKNLTITLLGVCEFSDSLFK